MEEGGTGAVLNSSQNGYQHDNTRLFQLPAQQTAVDRDATSLLCHVGLGIDSD